MLYQANCSVCGKPVKPAESKGQLARNMGIHKKVEHGISGREGGGGYIPVAMRPGHPKYAGNTSPDQLDSLAKARLARMEERKRAKLREQEKQAFPMALKQCPQCEGEFLRRVKGKMESIKQTQCEVCKIRFYFATYVQVSPAPMIS